MFLQKQLDPTTIQGAVLHSYCFLCQANRLDHLGDNHDGSLLPCHSHRLNLLEELLLVQMTVENAGTGPGGRQQKTACI